MKFEENDKVIVVEEGHPKFNQIFTVIEPVGYDGVYGQYVRVKNEEGESWALAARILALKERDTQEVLQKEEWVVGKTFIVPRERDNGTMLPFYPVIRVCENGVSFIDDNGFTRNMLFRNVRQVDPVDTHERIIDLASSFAKMKEEYDKKFDRLEKALTS